MVQSAGLAVNMLEKEAVCANFITLQTLRRAANTILKNVTSVVLISEPNPKKRA